MSVETASGKPDTSATSSTPRATASTRTRRCSTRGGTNPRRDRRLRAPKRRRGEIKEDAIERLPELIDEVTEAIEDNGGTVYIADDAADANRYISDVVDGRNVVKSKSMTSEELEVNDALEASGADVWETDLAEFVLQIADEAPPSHIVAPAIHKSREEIAALFNEVFEPDEPLETAEELTRFARGYLGERFSTLRSA